MYLHQQTVDKDGWCHLRITAIISPTPELRRRRRASVPPFWMYDTSNRNRTATERRQCAFGGAASPVFRRLVLAKMGVARISLGKVWLRPRANFTANQKKNTEKMAVWLLWKVKWASIGSSWDMWLVCWWTEAWPNHHSAFCFLNAEYSLVPSCMLDTTTGSIFHYICTDHFLTQRCSAHITEVVCSNNTISGCNQQANLYNCVLCNDGKKKKTPTR